MKYEEQQSANPEAFHALALTGGGYRGLFTASVLATIEERAGQPIGRLFDICAGTSIGGIVALAAAFEVPMTKVVETFTTFGPEIFPFRVRPTGMFGQIADYLRYRNRPRYQSQPLANAVEHLIPTGTKLGEALHPVLVPATNLTEGKPQVFKTRHHRSFERDARLPVTGIALATAAAPTFFPLAVLDGQMYADGALFANAPDQAVVHEAEQYLGIAPEHIRVLSIGTTTQKYSVSFSSGVDFGIEKWTENARILSVIISAQQQFVAQLMEHRLGDRFLRIDVDPSPEQSEDLGLDIVTDASTLTLMSLGTKATTNLFGGRIAPFLSHKPKNWLLGGA